MKKLLLICFIFNLQWLNAQTSDDVINFQVINYLNNPLSLNTYINPAYSGFLGFKKVQYVSSFNAFDIIDNPYNNTLTYDQNIGKGKRLGIGVCANHFNYQSFYIGTLDLNMSYKIIKSDVFNFSFGITPLSYNFRRINGNYSYPDNYDRIYGAINSNPEYNSWRRISRLNYFDFKVGILTNYKNAFFGVSTYNIKKKYLVNDSSYKPAIKDNQFEGIIGVQLNISSNLSLTPVLQYHYNYNLSSIYTLSLLANYKDIGYIGIERNNNSFVALKGGIKLFKRFYLNISAGTQLKTDPIYEQQIAKINFGINYLINK
ncbi:MAG: type IX secretion system membrane protein PorP/SprF [Bacteroidota bacterium]